MSVNQCASGPIEKGNMSKIIEGGNFERWNDPEGNLLIALNRDGTIDCGGVNLIEGGINFVMQKGVT